MLFGLIAGPVVLGPVDGAGLQRRVYLIVGHGHRRRAQRAHHVVHQLALRHADAQPGQVLQRLHGAHVVVKMPCAGVIPRKPHQAGAVQRRQELVPDLAVQHLPHVVAAAVEVGQLQYVELGHAVAQRHDRDAGKIQPAELQLLDDRGLVARDRVGVDVDDDAPAGAFLHQLGKALGAQGGGVVGGLVFGVGEHVLGHRLRRGGRRPRAGAQHGGANLKVMHQLDYILQNVENPRDDGEVREFLRKILRREAGDGSGLIYGMGHAVYTVSDPRAQILKNHARRMAYEKGYDEEYEMLCSIERLAPQIFAEEKHGPKKVCANVDLFSGLIYRMLGISEDLYTPLFAIARVPGWCAHRVEEVEFANRIIRPAYKYVGQAQDYVTLDER